MDELKIEHPDHALDVEGIVQALARFRSVFHKGKFQLAIAWIYFKAFWLVLFRFFKARTGLIIYHINAWTAAYRFITAKEFLTMYPAVKTCKKCNYGQGYYIGMRPDKVKEIMFCECVLKQYRKSEKRFIVRGIE
jgi:hypothetical protein